MKYKFFFFCSLILVWLGLVGISDLNKQSVAFLIGASLLTFIFALKLGVIPKSNHFKLGSVTYFIWLLKEIIMSSIAVVKISCRKNLSINPVFDNMGSMIKNNVGDVIYANSITLTPGTVTLSVDNKTFYVHALDKQFMNDLAQGEMESRVKKIIK
jgi:multicomponent Na+:H+ antiporter subunit E